MAWELRGRAGPYLYRSVRKDGRVVKQYLGSGPQAQAAVRKLEQQQQALLAERDALSHEQVQVSAAEAQLREVQDLVRTLVRATLLAAGYYDHRGQWRRRNHARDGNDRAAAKYETSGDHAEE